MDLIKADFNAQMINLEQRAVMIAKSGLIPYALKGKPWDILVIFMMAQELDIPPMQALNGINVINGKPTISPQLMIAQIRRRCPNAYIKISIDEKNISATCAMARDNSDIQSAYVSSWDMEKAKKLMLSGKDNYIKQPTTMLKWRAVSDAARTVFPDILSGMYFPDEFQEGEFKINSEGEITVPIEVHNDKDEVLLSKMRSLMQSLTNNFEDRFKLGKLFKDNLKTEAHLVASASDEQKNRWIKILEEEIEKEKNESTLQ